MIHIQYFLIGLLAFALIVFLANHVDFLALLGILFVIWLLGVFVTEVLF